MRRLRAVPRAPRAGQAPIPPEAAAALAAAETCLGTSLIAAWLHGSAVAGGLKPDSDVDLLWVIDRPMTEARRTCLLAELMRISGRPRSADRRRPLELVVFTAAGLAPLPYPPQAEFHYGEWLRSGFEAGTLPRPQANPDLVIVIAQVRQAAVTLVGPPPKRLLPTIAERDLRRAIVDARPGLLADLHGDERNVLLTLARMWCTLETGRIVPKDTAAEWAARRLAGPTATLLDRARLAYLGLVTDDWRDIAADEVTALARELDGRVARVAEAAEVRKPVP